MNIFALYKIQMMKKAQKALDDIHEPEYSKIIFKIHDIVSANLETVNIKKLQGYPDMYRLKMDNYRIIFVAIHDQKTVMILLIGHRREIYDLVKRMNF